MSGLGQRDVRDLSVWWDFPAVLANISSIRDVMTCTIRRIEPTEQTFHTFSRVIQECRRKKKHEERIHNAQAKKTFEFRKMQEVRTLPAPYKRLLETLLQEQEQSTVQRPKSRAVSKYV